MEPQYSSNYPTHIRRTTPKVLVNVDTLRDDASSDDLRLLDVSLPQNIWLPVRNGHLTFGLLDVFTRAEPDAIVSLDSQNKFFTFFPSVRWQLALRFQTALTILSLVMYGPGPRYYHRRMSSLIRGARYRAFGHPEFPIPPPVLLALLVVYDETSDFKEAVKTHVAQSCKISIAILGVTFALLQVSTASTPDPVVMTVAHISMLFAVQTAVQIFILGLFLSFETAASGWLKKSITHDDKQDRFWTPHTVIALPTSSTMWAIISFFLTCILYIIRGTSTLSDTEYQSQSSSLLSTVVIPVSSVGVVYDVALL